MDYRRANRAFLYMILASVALTFVVVLWFMTGGKNIPILLNNVLSELMILIPGLAAVFYSGDSFKHIVPFHRIKISSAFYTVIYVILLFPLVAFVNAVSMLFVDNAVSEISGDILNMPIWTMILSIGIFGPLVEEIAFRGIILQSYHKTGKILGAVILSSILFGAMHMNFNQFAYATVMGVMLALLVEATGSVLTSFLAHAVFNSIEILMMFSEKDVFEEASELFSEAEESAINAPFLGILFLAAIIATTIALCLVYKISENEGRSAFFANIVKSEKKGYQLVTVPLVLALTISFGYMIMSVYI
jgi:membrane protease YdiL (CAAX protease family)